MVLIPVITVITVIQHLLVDSSFLQEAFRQIHIDPPLLIITFSSAYPLLNEVIAAITPKDIDVSENPSNIVIISEEKLVLAFCFFVSVGGRPLAGWCIS